MAKLYPPNIEGTLPAFYGSSLIVPFSMNRAVSVDEVRGFAIKIKRVNDNSLVISQRTTDFDITNAQEAYFKFSDSTLFQVGEFYKVQIAYIENSDKKSISFEEEAVGYYSTVGIVKCTTEPRVYIEGLETGNVNIHNYHYVGVYSQTDNDLKYLDTTEKLYMSQFKLLDSNYNVVKTSGLILHDNSKDTERYQATEEFFISDDLDIDVAYYLVYSVQTANGLEVSSPRYRLMQRRKIPMTMNVSLKAEMDFERGAVDLIFKTPMDIPQVAAGSFLISRLCVSKDGDWEEFKYFYLQNENVLNKTFTDYTVEQGLSYQYSVQQYNANGVYSDRIISNIVDVDFEDVFLFDGERQLRVRFNPKVTNLKNDVVEQKTETIGSQYPFILRNGKIKYKEFGISGLISYHMDEEETFLSRDKLGVQSSLSSRRMSAGKAFPTKPANKNLTDYNIAAERIFKLDLLDWLTNGKPKVFRSPTEGNYIVRLMNVSLTPNDNLGRMLHSFQCTAYEIADFTYSNLDFYNLITLKETQRYIRSWTSVLLADTYTKEIAVDEWVKINAYPAYNVVLSDMLPGTQFAIMRKSTNDEMTYFTIGATGSYSFDLVSAIDSIYIQNTPGIQGQLTYSYKFKSANVFENIVDTDAQDIPCRQFIGVPDILVKPDYLKMNILEQLSDIRRTVLNYSYVRFYKRDLKVLYIAADTDPSSATEFYPFSDNKDVKYTLNDLQDDYSIYDLRYQRSDYTYAHIKGEGYYVSRNEDDFTPSSGYVLDMAAYDINGQKGAIYEPDEYFYCFTLDGSSIISLEQTENFEADESFEVSYTGIGPGVVCELGYWEQITIYSFETLGDVLAAKKEWEAVLEEYLIKRATTGRGSLATVEIAYNDFIKKLELAILEYEGANSQL